MKRITWVNLLHWYQPPWQQPEIVAAITRESYELLANEFERFPHFRATINVAGALLELWQANGNSVIIERLRALAQKNQIEIVGSSFSHAFLPEIPENEIERQIRLQEAALETLGVVNRPRGFFLPEMAYSPRVGMVIKRLGYKWIMLDPASADQTPHDTVRYQDEATGLTVLFRNRKLSKKYPPEEIFKRLETRDETTVITATDAELYGHFHQDWQDHLNHILKSDAVHTVTVSDYIDSLTETSAVRLRAASWETSTRHAQSNNPFSNWLNHANPIHKRLWALAHRAIELVNSHESDPNFSWARRHLDRGLSSCSFWWASEIKTSPFAPIAWNPDEVERGALELIKSIRSLSTVTPDDKIKSEKIYHDLLVTLWSRHWKIYGKEK